MYEMLTSLHNKVSAMEITLKTLDRKQARQQQQHAQQAAGDGSMSLREVVREVVCQMEPDGPHTRYI